MKIDREFTISHYGVFVDKTFEKVFFNEDIGNNIKYIKPIILTLGILFMLFIIPDYFLIRSLKILLIIFFIRSVCLLLILAFCFSIEKIKGDGSYAGWLTALEIVVTSAFLTIYYFYESPDFLIQTMGIIVILIGIYLAPNKWICTQIAAITVSFIFIIMSSLFMSGIELSEFSAGIVYLIIVMALCSISSFRTNYIKRDQYINSRELLRVSHTDSLTGIYNRGKFNDELTKWIDYATRYKVPLSMVIFDFDNFKRINDNYGHLVGDQVIVDTVGIISETIRQTDVFARWGGEEFVLLLPNTDIQSAKELTERLRKLIAGNTFDFGQSITCSFGLASLRDDDTEDIFLRRADELLYEAKEAGKNMIAC